MTALKVEKLYEDCCITCSSKGDDLINLEDNSDDTVINVTLHQKLVSLCNNKKQTIAGSICERCKWRAEDAWNFQQQLLNIDSGPSIADKIRIIRSRLKELTKTKEVVIVLSSKDHKVNSVNIEFDKDFITENNLHENTYPNSIPNERLNSEYELKSFLEADLNTSQFAGQEKKYAIENCRSCDNCQKLFPNSSEIKNHSCSLSCPKCNEEFSSKDLLSEHFKDAHGVTSGKQSFICQICVSKRNISVFNTAELLAAHLKKHNQTHPYVCAHNGCSQRYGTPSEISNHFKIVHQNVNHVKCLFCNEDFTSLDILRQHKKDDHKIIECPICSREFQGEFAMNRHMSVHKPKKQRGKTLRAKRNRTSTATAPTAVKHEEVYLEDIPGMEIEVLDMEFLE